MALQAGILSLPGLGNAQEMPGDRDVDQSQTSRARDRKENQRVSFVYLNAS
jgi:hypothetical protein